MLRLRTRIKNLVLDRLREKVLFQPSWRERACRQEFFYNAFKALAFNGIDGDYAEFGCSGGMTFALAYHESRRHEHQAKLWAFDSFRGLPASRDARDQQWKEGMMATSLDTFHKLCASNGIPKEAYKVVPGFYEQSLTTLSPDHEPRNIALAYVDCDLYSSTTTVLRFLEPRLKHGMIIAFDDYFCWSPSQVAGERSAMLELFSHHNRWALVPLFPFGWHGNSFVVEDRRIVG
jgi:O-methyltransferase